MCFTYLRLHTVRKPYDIYCFYTPLPYYRFDTKRTILKWILTFKNILIDKKQIYIKSFKGYPKGSNSRSISARFKMVYFLVYQNIRKMKQNAKKWILLFYCSGCNNSSWYKILFIFHDSFLLLQHIPGWNGELSWKSCLSNIWIQMSG